MKTEIEIIKWWKPGGGMMYNTEFLDPDHEMHPYNQAIAQGVLPEDFGIEHPNKLEFENKTRTELIDEVLTLRKELSAYIRAGF